MLNMTQCLVAHPGVGGLIGPLQTPIRFDTAAEAALPLD